MTEQMKQVLEKDKNQLYTDDYCYIDLSDYDIDISDRSNKWIGDRLEDAAKHFFDKGATSYRNNVWHDTCEKPEERKELLVYKKRDCDDSFYTALYSSDNDTVFINGRWYKLSTMTRWAYIEDLVADNMSI